MSWSSLMQELRDNKGNAVGVRVDGYLLSKQGLILTDTDGVQWLLTVGTDGTPSFVPVTGIGGP